ncbi:protein-export chaperone SecB [Neobacillus muris]|uniref:protein-export chaperone SecB n=1 Tax=Neobacillus muris TaxID=2941334 RepID=UPI00203AB1C7|nr:protein-export chaperone SecB [Neobacillus muris]
MMDNVYNQLIRAVDLDNIFIQSCNSQRFHHSLLKSSQIDTNIQMTQRLEYYKDDFFATSAFFDIKAFEEDHEENLIFNIQFTFILEYRISGLNSELYNSEELQKALDQFVKNNVPVNVWPYGREFIAQITTRMGLPQLLIGTYKYFPQNDEVEE